MHPSIGVEMMPVTPTLAAQLNQQAVRRGQEFQQQELEAQNELEKQEQQQDQQGKSTNRRGKQQQQQQQKRQPAASAVSKEGRPPPPPESGQIHYIPEGGAVVVINVLEDSPAQAAGLQNLDILLEIDHRPIYRVEDAQKIIQASGVGRDLEIKVLRRTQEVTLHVKTTDFLSLFRKQQATKRYPELSKRRSKEVTEESSPEHQQHSTATTTKGRHDEKKKGGGGGEGKSDSKEGEASRRRDEQEREEETAFTSQLHGQLYC